jgi:phospholipid/cholesterol/gamma-HCH transport system substrate-binding protein
VVVIAFLLFASSSSYDIRLSLQNASQLVKGDPVKVGGIPVGSIDSISLGQDGYAQIDASIDDDSVAPLHQGSRAVVRSESLSGVANRYIALTPGPENTAKIPSGGTIPAEDTTSEVDLDEVLNTLDPATLGDLRSLTRNASSAFKGEGDKFGQALADLDPALSQTDAVEQQILRDEGAFSRFLVESASVVGAVASRRPDLAQLIPSTRATLDAIASRNAALDSLLQRLPPTLRDTNTTLVNLRATLQDADPVIRDARPAAPLLRQTLDLLEPLAVNGRPVVATLRRTIDAPGNGDLLGVLEGFPPLERMSVPAFGSTVQTVQDLLPILNEARPYTPDVPAGLMNGFGGTTGGYYDANGHYARITVQSGVYSLNNEGSLVPRPGVSGLTGYREGVTRRCPGAATQPAPDKSNPFGGEPVCSPGDTPR